MNKKKPDTPVSLRATPRGYADWLGELKRRIRVAHQRAALVVNRESDEEPEA